MNIIIYYIDPDNMNIFLVTSLSIINLFLTLNILTFSHQRCLEIQKQFHTFNLCVNNSVNKYYLSISTQCPIILDKDTILIFFVFILFLILHL